MGTPDFAVPSLRAVTRACEVAAVVTQPDRPSGRGRQETASAIAHEAESLGLATLKPADVNHASSLASLKALSPDLFAVVAFGSILTRELLGTPRIGCINLHGSLLPDYRGASPVQRALWDGRCETGVTTLWMDEGIDTGDCILQRVIRIEESDDAGSLATKLAEAGGPLLAESLVLAHQGRAPRQPQDRASGSYARKLRKEDGVVRWTLDAVTLWNHQRAVTPWPGATAGFRGRRLGILACRPRHRLATPEAPGTVVRVADDGVEVACDPGVLIVHRVKEEGRHEMNASEWARGARIEPGESLQWQKETDA